MSRGMSVSAFAAVVGLEGGIEQARQLLAIMTDEEIGEALVAGQTLAHYATGELHDREHRRRYHQRAGTVFPAIHKQRFAMRTTINRALMGMEGPDIFVSILKKMIITRYRDENHGQSPPSDAVFRIEVLDSDHRFLVENNAIEIGVTLTWDEVVPA